MAFEVADPATRTKGSTNEKGTAFVAGLAHVTLGADRFGYIDKKGKTVFEYRWFQMGN